MGSIPKANAVRWGIAIWESERSTIKKCRDRLATAVIDYLDNLLENFQALEPDEHAHIIRAPTARPPLLKGH